MRGITSSNYESPSNQFSVITGDSWKRSLLSSRKRRLERTLEIREYINKEKARLGIHDMINNCVCYNKSFEGIKKEAEALGLKTIEEVIEGIECAKACKMCVPYIETMLKTGQTEFTWN